MFKGMAGAIQVNKSATGLRTLEECILQYGLSLLTNAHGCIDIELCDVL